MYRLMLYYLIVLVVFGTIFNGIDVAIEALFLVLICYSSNKIFAKIFKATTNLESFAITALILSLIIGPTTNLFFLTSAAILAMGSKYFLAINKRHIFNPAAIAVVLTALLFHQGASWWTGSSQMTIPIILGGLLVLKKIRRFILVAVFLIFSLVTNFDSPLLFFASVMLIEPLTSPSTKNLQIIYGALVAILFWLYSLFSLPYSLELALVTGNLFSFFATPHFHFVLRLKSKTQLTSNIIQFNFLPDKKFNFIAGQYLELTLLHNHPDNRGVRRFFTISSSPTEDEIIITSKFVENGSSFKKAILNLKPGGEIISTSPAGEFILPKNPQQKLAFIAGGIGITPFRSMAKFLLDSKQSRDIVLISCAATEQEFIFKNLFPEAVYKVGRLKTDDIKNAVPDYNERIFYVSGPELMVQATEKMLSQIGIQHGRINRDYFPGYQA